MQKSTTPWYTSRWAIIGYHVLAWLVWFSFPYLTQMGMASQQHFRPPPEMMEEFAKRSGQPFHVRTPPPNVFLLMKSIQNVFLLGLFYLNAYYLMPRLLHRKKNGQYVLVLVSIMIAMLYGSWLLHQLLMPNDDRMNNWFMPLSSFGALFLFTIALSLTYRTIVDKIANDSLLKEKENANLQTELSFLRSQISPHFMFNVLNNMVALARKKSDQLEDSLIKLSGLMRYMLYEADASKVPVEKELEYLKSYIDLQQQRFAGSVDVNVQIEWDEQLYYIEPMLLIPFVENAFKHGVGLVMEPQINIFVQVKNRNLLMEVRNKFNDHSHEVKDNTSGIGLSNAKRRLDLLYGNQHHLLMRSEGEWFYILLQLELS